MLINVSINVTAVTTSMVCVTLGVNQDGGETTVKKYAYTDTLDRTVLTNVTTHAKDVTMKMVCVILVVILAGRETTVMKLARTDFLEMTVLTYA